MNRKTECLILALTMTVILLSSYILYTLIPLEPVIEKDPSGLSAASHFQVHMIIKFWKDGKIVFQQYHAGFKTSLGMNVTFAKETGNATLYNMTQYNFNTTFVSIGNGTAPTIASTILPNEWAKVVGVQHAGTYGGYNITAVITPPVGPNWADCIGLNFEAVGLGFHDLIYYDTFSTVKGIDNSFTITVEFQVTGS